jgi:methyl-accepting chemotaxis protein
MKNWTIGKRITTGFASIILIALGLGLFAYTRLIAIRGQSERITQVSLPTVTMIAHVRRNVIEAERIVYTHIGSSDKEDMARLDKQLSAVSAESASLIDDIAKLVTDEQGTALLNKIKATRADLATEREKVLVLSRQATNTEAAYNLGRTVMDPVAARFAANIQDLFEHIQKNADQTANVIQATVRSSQLGLLLGVGLAAAIGVIVGLFITKNTARILKNVTNGLDEGASQVSSAAGEVSTASQSLAEGASEQAASLEETSSSLEEMASMTKRNSENALKANDLAKEARSAADKGANDMQTMSAAMEAIKVSSDDIAKIIKTIDEIAFQTNILALNAAVEAARAGEAGMGFAVVADEVRNLAQRSAQAAKETAGKIEGAIAKTGQGVEISTQVAQTLSNIVTKVRQVDELVSEVANASREQTQGITQINTAVTQMDKVTQSNAASAEESAAAAEELNSQAEVMKHSVSQLLELVGGSQGSTAPAATSPRTPAKAAKAFRAPAPAPKRPVILEGTRNGNGHSPAASPATAAADPRKAIPMEGDFTSF